LAITGNPLSLAAPVFDTKKLFPILPLGFTLTALISAVSVVFSNQLTNAVLSARSSMAIRPNGFPLLILMGG